MQNVDTLKKHTCNWCGESCFLCEDPTDPTNTENGFENGLLDCKVEGTYNSTPGNGMGALDDQTVYEFSLCEFCLDYLFSLFKNPVKTYDVHDGVESWRPAFQRVNEDDWRVFKKKFFEEFNKRSKYRQDLKNK